MHKSHFDNFYRWNLSSNNLKSVGKLLYMNLKLPLDTVYVMKHCYKCILQILEH